MMDYAYYNTQSQQSSFHQQPFEGFPTPVSQYAQSIGSQPTQDTYPPSTAFQPYDPSYQFNHSDGSFVTSQPQQQPSPPLHDVKDPTLHTKLSTTFPNGDYMTEQAEDGNRSSSEEGKESLTPAQSRRKAQNRAAQRAFRERKERHVKDLETKLHSLSAHSSTLLSDNERLKRELQRLATQNEILRATSSHAAAYRPSPESSNAPRSPSPISGPQVYSPIDFQAALGEGHHPVSFEDFGGPEGERLLAVGAAWDFVINDPAYRRGEVDMQAVHTWLKGKTFCNGRGPAFREQDVRRAIEECTIKGGGDGLL